MGSVHLYEVKMIDGSRYCGEIAYEDDKKIILRLVPFNKSGSIPKIRLFYNGIMSIKELGWRRRF